MVKGEAEGGERKVKGEAGGGERRWRAMSCSHQVCASHFPNVGAWHC